MLAVILTEVCGNTVAGSELIVETSDPFFILTFAKACHVEIR